MKKLLIIEDSKDVNDMLCQSLEAEGYQVKSVYDGLAGMRELKSEVYDMVLLDIMLPYKSGDEILRELRQFSNVPVMILSAKDMVGVKIDLLKLGADDYITKPFDLGEVVARVATHLRRTMLQNEIESIFTYKDLELNANQKRLTAAGVEIELTSKEYLIMELLIKHKGKVFSKANIYETLWGEEYLGDDNAVKTHMSNLRNKLKKVNPDEEYIETVWGMGYRLCRIDL
jgi:DNA-binding response OmpR family regulator